MANNLQILEIKGNGGVVTHQLINGYVEQCNNHCNICRHVMQKARSIVTEAPEWYRRNFELTCYAEHFSLIFWAGSRGNKMVVQVVAGNIEVTVTGESWRAWFTRGFQQCWTTIRKIAVYVLERIPLNSLGGFLAMITGGGKLDAIAN